MCNPAVKPTNQPTDMGENITSVVEVTSQKEVSNDNENKFMDGDSKPASLNSRKLEYKTTNTLTNAW